MSVMPDDSGPQGNTAVSLNLLGVENSKGLNIFSSLIGAMADIGGAIGLVSTIINLFSPQSDPLQPILEELQQDFSKLYADLTARFNELDWTILAQEVSASESEVGILDGLVNAQPPLDEADRLAHVAVCLTPLNALSDVSHPPATFFLTPYDAQTYWTDTGVFAQTLWSEVGNNGTTWQTAGESDAGYGLQAPPVPADNQVFFYVYVLPYYLRAVMLLAAVGTALFPDFGRTQEHQHDELVLYANFLISIHDLIAGSIIGLLPYGPPWSEVFDEWATATVIGQTPVITGIIGNFSGGGNAAPQLDDMTAYWGAVEIFSGTSSVQTGDIPVAGDENDDYAKLKVRVLREKMAVYALTGMPDVWATINTLLALAGEPPFPVSKYGAWSFREIFLESGLIASDTFFHLSQLAELLQVNAPLDTAQTGPPFSFRDLLEPS